MSDFSLADSAQLDTGSRQVYQNVAANRPKKRNRAAIACRSVHSKVMLWILMTSGLTYPTKFLPAEEDEVFPYCPRTSSGRDASGDAKVSSSVRHPRPISLLQSRHVF